MQGDSMIIRRDSTAIAMTRNAWHRASSGRIVVIAVAVLIQAILTLGFVAMSLGLGANGQAGVGPDRPPPPAAIAPDTR